MVQEVQNQVFKGECAKTTDNILLSKVHFDGIPSAPCGVPQIEATFDIDTNESLNVPAQNKFTGRSNQITIANKKGRPSQTETDHVVQEAERCNDEDQTNKLKIEVKNGLKNHCVSMRNTFIDGRHDEFEAEHKERTEESVHAGDWLDKNPCGEKHEFEAKQKELKGPGLAIQRHVPPFKAYRKRSKFRGCSALTRWRASPWTCKDKCPPLRLHSMTCSTLTKLSMSPRSWRARFQQSRTIPA